MNRKEVAIIGVITFATVLVWIMFGVSHAQQTTIISSEQQAEIVPLTPTFDNDIIKTLSLREE